MKINLKILVNPQMKSKNGFKAYLEYTSKLIRLKAQTTLSSDQKERLHREEGAATAGHVPSLILLPVRLMKTSSRVGSENLTKLTAT